MSNEKNCEMKITKDCIEYNGTFTPIKYPIRIAVLWLLGIVASSFLFSPHWMIVAIPAAFTLAIIANMLLWWGHVFYHVILYKITGKYHI
jgi:membrane protein YdbS with pleckstrin-like domain